MPRWLAESLGISLAAQAATLPDVLATFGRLSLVSPAVNLAVVPLVPVAMLGGVLALWPAARSPPSGRRLPWPRCCGLPGWLVLHVVIAARPDRRRSPVRGGHAAARGVAPRGGRCRRGAVARGARRVSAGFDAGVHAGGARPYRPRRRAGPGRGSAITPAAPGGARRRRDRSSRSAARPFGDATGRATRITVLDVGQGDAILARDPDRRPDARRRRPRSRTGSSSRSTSGSRRGTAGSTSSC